MTTPPISHRAQKNLQQKMQSGVVQALTTVANPPAGFPAGARTIALIELADGTNVLASLTTKEGAHIGQHVQPRMRLQQINTAGLRLYDVSYEPLVRVPIKKELDFPGYIIALSGPSGVGKSTVSELFTKAAADYVARVPIITTRQKKRGDNNEYTYTTAKSFAKMQQRGAIIASTVIPSCSEDRQYGYRATDIQAIWESGKIPVVVTEQALLQGLAAHFGRRSILSFGLLPPGKSRRAMLSQLLHRLRSRGRDSEENIADRMKNAASDLDFLSSEQELFDHIVVNEHLDTVIDMLKTQVLEKNQTLKSL